MKKAVLILALALLATGAWAVSLNDLSFSAGYARSFDKHAQGAIFTLSLPVHEWQIAPLTSLVLNVDANAVALNNSEFQGGPGGCDYKDGCRFCGGVLRADGRCYGCGQIGRVVSA